MLADLGAEVLRVESPTRQDMVRSMPPLVGGESAAHHHLNRNKRSLALDLKQAEAVAIVKRLVLEYDIIIEQFRPGVMQRLGLDYETLREINPRLIYCSISGYGQTGPYRLRAGHDLNYLATAGVSSYTGRADSGPLPLGIQLADIAGGSHHAIMGILAAEIQRRDSGVGQYLDISMTDAAFAINAMAGAGALAAGVDPQPEQEWLNGGSFYDCYRCKDGRFLSIGGLEPPFVEALSKALDEPALLELVDLHNIELQRRLKPLLVRLIAQRDCSDWCHLFAGLDCCVEPVLSINEAADHDQLQARGMVIRYDLADGNSIRQAACPIKFAPSPQPAPRPAPATGAHSREVLLSLGYDDKAIEALLAAP
jgi:crotonobetainyl-CoA:carnitine CoA-transferase CaiB-like acyl-CoA transferase